MNHSWDLTRCARFAPEPEQGEVRGVARLRRDVSRSRPFLIGPLAKLGSSVPMFESMAPPTNMAQGTLGLFGRLAWVLRTLGMPT